MPLKDNDIRKKNVIERHLTENNYTKKLKKITICLHRRSGSRRI